MNARKTVAPRVRSDWTIAEEVTVHGRRVTPGTELSIAGVRGRFRFLRRVSTESGADWIDVRDGSGQPRAFHLGRIRTVHLRRSA